MKNWVGLLFLLTALAAGGTATSQSGLALGSFEPNIPLVLLESKTNIYSEQKVPCTVRVLCPKGASCGATNTLSGGIKLHGASSRGLPKKSLSFSLDAAGQLLDMRQDDNWILNAAYIDRSLMRHKLSYDLFRSLSAGARKRYAVASRFVEVFVNGKYNGVYLLMERADRSLFDLRPFQSNEVSHACIYKAVDHAANFTAPGHSGYEQREPDPAVKAYWKPLDEFNHFASTAGTEAFFHPQTGIASKLDLDNAIDFHLLVLLTSNSDGITKNFFFASDALEKGKPPPRFFFAPWDYDGTFGRNWDASPYPASAWLSNHLFERLLGDKEYRLRFAGRWKELRQKEFSPSTIQGMIEENVRTLGPAAGRNALRWPTTHGYPDRLTFQEDIAQIKAWIEARVKWLDQEIGQR